VGLGLLITVAAAHAGGNTLAVNAGAAIDGAFGLQMIMNSDVNSTYVAENTAHNSETTHNIDFKINANALTMAEFTNHTIHMSRQPGDNVIKVNLVRQNNQFKIVAFTQRENGQFKWSGKFTINPATNQGRVQYEWAQASGTGMSDGFFRLIKGTGVEYENVALDNWDNVVDVVRFGVAQGADTTTSGSFALDTYTATR
jgi:hypothetical protein